MDDNGDVVAPGEATQALYPGDCGTLPEAARRVMVQLLAGPSVDGRRHGRLWPALLHYQEPIRSRLADLFLELVLDPEARVAYLRQADTGEIDTPILLRRTRLTFIQSVLLLFLRQQLAHAEARGERAVVSSAEMLEQMKLYEPEYTTDRAGFDKRVNAAIEKLKEASLLSTIRGSDGRFEIAPTLKLLFSAEEVAALGRRYRSAWNANEEDAPKTGAEAP